MNDSILLTVAKAIGLPEDYPIFDPDFIMLINSELSTLIQLGGVPEEGFKITGSGETWTQLFGERNDLEFIKEYVYLRVKLIFDPPQNSNVYNMLKAKTDELQFRILVATEEAEA